MRRGIGCLFLCRLLCVRLWRNAGPHGRGRGDPGLIPGVSFTNGIRDIADGDYLSGTIRLLDALLVYVCIAIGVGLAFWLGQRIFGGVL